MTNVQPIKHASKQNYGSKHTTSSHQQRHPQAISKLPMMTLQHNRPHQVHVNLEPETSAHLFADCLALSFNRSATLKMDQLTTPCKWKLNQIPYFLKAIAAEMEDTTDHKCTLHPPHQNGLQDRLEDPQRTPPIDPVPWRHCSCQQRPQVD